MNENVDKQDFIVSELLSELKTENARKGKLINALKNTVITTIIVGLIAVLVTCGGFLLYLNQYDFSGTTSTEYTTTQTAEGVYAIIDSNGNVISQDLTAQQVQQLMEVLTASGESNSAEEAQNNGN